MINAAKRAMEKILKYGECYIVGGAVRDHILSKPIHDIDIVTNVDMKIIEQLFETIDIGKNKDFGILVIKFEDYTFEVAHTRCDGYNTDLNGKGATDVKLTDSFEEDSNRRDFTMNAMLMDINDKIIDYNNGFDHINKNIIVTCGFPSTRFMEDYIRMMRACRFAAKYGMTLSPNIGISIKCLAKYIIDIAPERITQELFKAASLTGSQFEEYIRLLKSTGLLTHILPEIDCYDKFDHSPEHHPEGAYVIPIE